MADHGWSRPSEGRRDHGLASIYGHVMNPALGNLSDERQYSTRPSAWHPHPHLNAWDSHNPTAPLVSHPPLPPVNNIPSHWPSLEASMHRPTGYRMPNWNIRTQDRLSQPLPRTDPLSPDSRYHSREPSNPSNHSRRHAPLPSNPPRVTVDFRDLEYIQPYSENLVCPICHVPFITPVALSCDHIFCGDCLETALEHQPPESRSCPFCRTYATSRDIAHVPQMINNMLDELKVQCPLKSKGCSQVINRGVVEQHVALYCDHTEVDCPDKSCRRKIERIHTKDGRCCHKLIKCAGCEEDIAELLLSEHQGTTCQAMAITCPDCERDMLRSELSSHAAVCAEARISCSAASYGCKFTGKTQEINDHQNTCPIQMLGPYLQAQTSRIDVQETKIKHLEQQNSVYRACFSVLEDILGCDLLAESSSTDTNYRPRTGDAAQTSVTNGAHIIAHIDSLREELQEQYEQVTRGIADLEARQNTMVLNETLRQREEVAQFSATLTNMRVQINWLLNTRQHIQSPVRRGSLSQNHDARRDGPSALGRPGPSRESNVAIATGASGRATTDTNIGSRDFQWHAVDAHAGPSRDTGNSASSNSRQDPKL
jgi:hypothetical protein